MNNLIFSPFLSVFSSFLYGKLVFISRTESFFYEFDTSQYFGKINTAIKEQKPKSKKPQTTKTVSYFFGQKVRLKIKEKGMRLDQLSEKKKKRKERKQK
jgi:hypothetical protein